MATLITNMAPELQQLKLSLALILFDAFTGGNQLVGLYPSLEQERDDVALAIDPAGAARVAQYTTVRVGGRSDLVPRRREADATFVFFDLVPGAHTFEVRSPYYEPRDIVLALPRPDPRWPAFPDITLADETKPLDSPVQPAAYRAQRAQALLEPTVRYPFPPGATLVRGVVRRNLQPLAGASVRRQGDPAASITDANGEYVLFFKDIAGSAQAITLEFTHPLSIAVTAPVTVVRGYTVLQDVALL